MLTRRSATLLALSCSPFLSLVAGCAADMGSQSSPGDDGAPERTSQTSEAIGTATHAGCNSQNQGIASAVANGVNGEVTVTACTPNYAAWIIFQDTPLADGRPATQLDSSAAALTLYSAWGMYHQYMADFCYGDSFIHSCTGWVSPTLMYNPFPLTVWADTDATGASPTSPYVNGLQTGQESLEVCGSFDGLPLCHTSWRKLVTCAVLYNGTTQVGKGFADAPGDCFFGYGGAEMEIQHGVVLQGATPGQSLSWQHWWPSTGNYGTNPVLAGAEPSNWQYVCHAPFTNPGTGIVDTVPGKTIGTTCNISWGGTEYPIDAFSNDVEVLNASVL